MSSSRFEDPVIAEIHAVRAQMLAECGEDYQKFMERLRERQRASGRKVIPAPPATPGTKEPVTAPRASDRHKPV